jgi:tetratricopeptide (TPR) repeat protein
LLPIRLGIDYGRSPQWLWQSDAKYYSWLLPVVLLAVLILFRRRARAALVAAGVFVSGVLPVLGLVSFDFQAYSTVADHYLYLAMLGPALLVAWVVAASRGRLVAPVACAAVLGFGLRSYMQTWSWQSSRELYAHTLRVNRASLIGNVNLANVLSDEIVDGIRRGDYYGVQIKFEAAFSYYRQALRTRPHDPQATIGLANLMILLNKPEAAVPLYLDVMKRQGPSADLHAKIGRSYRLQKNYELARVHLHEALKLDPAHAAARIDLERMIEEGGGGPVTVPVGP